LPPRWPGCFTGLAQRARTPPHNLAGRKPATIIPNELGGSSPTPGVYSSGAFTINKTLTLNANHDPNATFVFQSAATLEAAQAARSS
jgi:hypothetical protein